VAEGGPDAPGPVLARAAERRDPAGVERERRVPGRRPARPQPGPGPGPGAGAGRLSAIMSSVISPAPATELMVMVPFTGSCHRPAVPSGCNAAGRDSMALAPEPGWGR